MKIKGIAIISLTVLLLLLSELVLLAGLVFDVKAVLVAGVISISVTLLLLLLVVIIPIYRIIKSLRQMESDIMVDDTFNNGKLENQFLGLIRNAGAQKQKEYSLEILKNQAELSALQSQINPHFLYNTLDSIRGQLLESGIDDAADTVEALSNLFRYSISPKISYNTLEQELNNIRDYMSIITYRFGNRTRFEIIMDAEEDILSCEMPKLTLQPVVENAIQHGLESKSQGGLITVRVQSSYDSFTIIVSDNGCGVPTEILNELNRRFRDNCSTEQNSKKGIALLNVNQRIKLMYGKEYGIYINSAMGIGTEVHINLPIRKGQSQGVQIE